MSPPPINVISSSPSESAVSDAPLTSPPPVEQQREGRSIKKRLSLSRATKGLRRMMRSSHSHARPELEYYDVCLRQEDIDNRKPDRTVHDKMLIAIVRPGEWLNDSNIEFFYEWMEREKLPKTEPQKIFLLRPSIGYCMYTVRLKQE